MTPLELSLNDILRVLGLTIYEALIMVGTSGLATVVLGLLLGVVLFVTQRGEIVANLVLSITLSTIANIIRSIPYAILMLSLIPFTWWLTGSLVGPMAACVSLTTGVMSFFARLVEPALRNVHPGRVDAAHAMGSTWMQTVTKVLLPEVSPPLTAVITTTVVTLVGYSIMAELIDGGGLGRLAYNYGYQHFKTSVQPITIAILVGMIQLIRMLGDAVIRCIDYRWAGTGATRQQRPTRDRPGKDAAAIRKHLSLLAALLTAILTLTACGDGSSSGKTKMRIGASPVPYAKTLECVRDNPTAKAGIETEIKELDDYVLPNSSLNNGPLDVNYSQHLFYPEDEIRNKGYKFARGGGIHIKPMFMFSKRYTDLSTVSGRTVAVINSDVTNQYCAFKLLGQAGLLKNPAKDFTVLNLTAEQNPRSLDFKENQPEINIQLLDDPVFDPVFVSSNFILSAGLNTSNASLAEQVGNNPYISILVWREGNTDQDVKKLGELLHSQQVKDFVKQTWSKSEVCIPS